MRFLLHPRKPKNPSQLIHNRQGCGWVAKNIEENHRTTGSIKGHAEEEKKQTKTKQKEKHHLPFSGRFLSNSSIVPFSNK